MKLFRIVERMCYSLLKSWAGAHPTRPPLEARAEARRHPNGWVYQIDGTFGPNDTVPPEAIVGVWKVNEHGEIVGEFVPNPNYQPQGTKKKPWQFWK